MTLTASVVDETKEGTCSSEPGADSNGGLSTLGGEIYDAEE